MHSDRTVQDPELLPSDVPKHLVDRYHLAERFGDKEERDRALLVLHHEHARKLPKESFGFVLHGGSELHRVYERTPKGSPVREVFFEHICVHTHPKRVAGRVRHLPRAVVDDLAEDRRWKEVFEVRTVGVAAVGASTR